MGKTFGLFTNMFRENVRPNIQYPYPEEYILIRSNSSSSICHVLIAKRILKNILIAYKGTIIDSLRAGSIPYKDTRHRVFDDAERHCGGATYARKSELHSSPAVFRWI
jgi:hypothetical protein